MAIDERDYHSYNKNEYPKFQVENKGWKKSLMNDIINLIAIILFGLAMYWFLNKGTQKTLVTIGENTAAKQQQLQKDLQLRAEQQRAQIEWQKKDAAEQAEMRTRIEAKQPHYERVFVEAKSHQECKRSDGVITEQVIWCQKNHYEKILVSGNQ